MDTNHVSIIQWNCRGLKANFEEIQHLICSYNPQVMCLQETHLKDTDTIKFKGFNIYNYTSVSPVDGRPIGGSSILVKKGIPHEVFKLETSLQAVAVQVTLHRTLTICSLYVPPRSVIKSEDLDSLVTELTGPYLLLGDLNAHSTLWGNQTNNALGDTVEKFVEHNDLSLLNDQSATYLHPATGSFSSIDLSLCSPSLFLDFHWNVHNDQCGSDHYPVFLRINKPMPHETVPKWKLHKANWSEFKRLANDLLKKDRFEGKTDPISLFSDTIIDIATQTIPKTSANSKCIPKPWFNTECLKAVKARKNALQKFSTEPTTENLNKYRSARANARRIIKTSKKESWRE